MFCKLQWHVFRVCFDMNYNKTCCITIARHSRLLIRLVWLICLSLFLIPIDASADTTSKSAITSKESYYCPFHLCQPLVTVISISHFVSLSSSSVARFLVLGGGGAMGGGRQDPQMYRQEKKIFAFSHSKTVFPVLVLFRKCMYMRASERA